MIQTLHIFRKDIRHLWSKLALYAVLLVAFVLVAPQLWQGASQTNPLLDIFFTLIKFFIPILWLVLIAHLVQEEALVGDQQFWTTRPYAWPSLLAAKLLFIVSLIVLPFLVAQLYLVHHAGLRLLSPNHGMASTFLAYALIVLIPFTVVSAVTSNLSRAFMSMMAIAGIWIGVLVFLTGHGGPRVIPTSLTIVSVVLFSSLYLGVLIYQYSRRETLRSRILLIATCLVWFLGYAIFLGTSITAPVNALVRLAYPADAATPVHLDFESGPRFYEQNGDLPKPDDGLVTLLLPIHLTGMDAAAKLHDTSASFTLTAPGFQYTAPFRPVNLTEHTLTLLVSQTAFDRLRTADSQLHVTFIAERLLPSAPQTVLASSEFQAPDNGNCILATGGPATSLVCRYAFQGPPPTRVEAPVAARPCGTTSPTRIGTANMMTFSPGTRVDPVIEERLALGGNLCPGASVTFTVYHEAGNLRLELDIPSIVLDHYVAH